MTGTREVPIRDDGPQHTVDARGLACPLPVIRLARVAKTLSPGASVLLLADDPAARADVPAWGRLTGHGVSVHDKGDHTAYLITAPMVADGHARIGENRT